MRNQAQGLHKRSCTLRKLVNTQIKGITLIYKGKIIFVPVAFLMALSIETYKNKYQSKQHLEHFRTFPNVFQRSIRFDYI